VRRFDVRRLSLRSQLLLGILLPVLVFVAFNTVSLYRQALRAANTAYDRTLLASAKSIGELLEVTGSGNDAHLKATVLYSALEAFEADNRSRMYYKVTGFAGEMVSGFEDLPAWRGTLPTKGPYAALVDFLWRLADKETLVRAKSMQLGTDPPRQLLQGTLTLVKSFQRRPPPKTSAPTR